MDIKKKIFIISLVLYTKILFGIGTINLNVTYTEAIDGIVFRFHNDSEKTVYLFNGYLNKECYSSKYLHRIDFDKSQYSISFIPLLYSLSVYPTDKRILGSEKVIKKGQVLYSFVEISLDSIYEIKLFYNYLFRERISQKEYVCDFDKIDNTKFNRLIFKYLRIDDCIDPLKLIFQFAFYDSINIMSKKSNYYFDEQKFNKQAVSYTKVQVPVQLMFYKDHIINK